MSTILGGEARVRVLRELFLHGSEISAPQLVARTGLAQSSVREALALLESTKVIDVLGAGKALLYRANAAHPLFASLHQLFSAEEARYGKIGERIGEALRAIRPKLESAWLFGSAARGDDRADSDIDLAVVTGVGQSDEVVYQVKEALAPLEAEFAIRLSVISLSRQEITRLARDNDPLFRSFVGDAILLFGRRPHQYGGMPDGVRSGNGGAAP